MPITELYSQRNKQHVDVYQYTSLSAKLKNQIIHIWDDFFSAISKDIYDESWQLIHTTLLREHGKKELIVYALNSYTNKYKIESYFDSNNDINECLDIVEIVFQVVLYAQKFYNSPNNYQRKLQYGASEAIADLNRRFKQNDAGFQFEQGKIIRLDNTLLHNQIIQETLQLLSEPDYKNANQEFLSAHEHFRKGRNKESLTDCIKALETTIKIICGQNGWAFSPSATTKGLLDVCFVNKLIPDFFQTQFSSLRSMLESIPTIRNKKGAHGQGSTQIVVPDHYVSYQLYLTGSTINFLIACQKTFTGA